MDPLNEELQTQGCWALANLASVGERQCEAIRLARDGMGLAALLETSRASSDIGLKLESLAALAKASQPNDGQLLGSSLGSGCFGASGFARKRSATSGSTNSE